jgi:hypothetical protein
MISRNSKHNNIASQTTDGMVRTIIVLHNIHQPAVQCIIIVASRTRIYPRHYMSRCPNFCVEDRHIDEIDSLVDA